MQFLTTKVLGYLSGGLSIALVVSAFYIGIQGSRLDAAQETIAAKSLVIETLEDRIDTDQTLIAQRDALIAEQNTAVLALSEASKANRQAYEQRIAQADLRAASYQAQAEYIMSRTLEAEDELERSRAALALIHEVVGKENE